MKILARYGVSDPRRSLLELCVKNKNFTDFVMYAVLAAFLSNLLPWFFH